MKLTVRKIICTVICFAMLCFTGTGVFASGRAEDDGTESYQLLQDIIDVYLEESLFETTREELIDTMLLNFLKSNPYMLASLANSMLSANDPYSHYYLASDGYLDGTSKSFGIITALETAYEDGRKPGIYIDEVIAGSNAEFAGVKAGDRFVSIDGYNVEGLTLKGMQYLLSVLPRADKPVEQSPVYGEFSKDDYDSERFMEFLKLDWDPRKEVEFRFERNGAIVTISMPRGISADKTVSLMLDKEKKTACISISSFAALDTGDRFLAAFEQAKAAGCENLIIDLRDNPGGFADIAYELGSKFTKGVKTLFYYRYRNEDEPVAFVSHGDYIGDAFKQYAVLTNGNTASAAELFAYILRSQLGAVIIGERSYGKGVGQEVFEVSNGDSFTITAFEVLTSTMKTYNEIGIEPDVYVPVIERLYEFPQGLPYFNHENYVEIKEGAENDVVLAIEKRMGILGLMREDEIDGKYGASTATAIFVYRAAVMGDKEPGTDVTFDMVTSVTNVINKYKDFYYGYDSQYDTALLYLENASRGKRLAKEFIREQELLDRKRLEEERLAAEEYEKEMRAERESEKQAEDDEASSDGE